MRRWRSALAAGLVGLVAGAVGVTALQPGQPPTTTTPVPSSTSSGSSPTTSAATSTTAVAPEDEPSQVESTLLVVWTSGGLPAGLASTVNDLEGVALVSEVRSDLVWLESEGEEGFVVPVEASAVDDVYDEIAPAEWTITLGGLEDGEVILSESSATLRSVEVGDVLSTLDRDLSVVGILPDQVVGATEMVTNLETGRGLAVTTSRYLLVVLEGDRTAFERSVREALPEGMAVRIRAPGETPFLRHGDAVLPQVVIKSEFGEFSLRSDGSGSFQIEAEWIAANLATVDLPLLGATTCHVGMITPCAVPWRRSSNPISASSSKPSTVAIAHVSSAAPDHCPATPGGWQSTSTMRPIPPDRSLFRTPAWSRSWSGGASPGGATGWCRMPLTLNG